MPQRLAHVSSFSLERKMMALLSSTQEGGTVPRTKRITISNAYSLTRTLSAIAWIITSYVSLSFHPDPKFADCMLRHNALTMGQAFAFPLPVAWASFEALRKSTKNNTAVGSKTFRRINLGVVVASFWLAASSMCPPAFAFGYDLYSFPHKLATAIIHGCTGIFALVQALRSSTITQII